MLAINFSFLLVIIIPIILIQVNATENLLKLFLAVGLFLLIRLFSFLLFDIISGFSSRKKRLYLTLLLILGTLILGAYSFTAYFHKHEAIEIMVVLSFLLVPILAYLSVKTFLVKEKIQVKEK
jgi:MFS family permease